MTRWTPYLEEPGDGGSGGGVVDAGGGTQDAAYWKGEAQKAFKDRDTAKARMRDLEGKALTDDQRAEYEALRTEKAKIDEDRKRAEGRFDELKTELVKKHTTELQEKDTRLSGLTERFRHSVVRAEFGGAVDWFGGDTAKTIFDPIMAQDVLGKYVMVEDVAGDPLGYRVVVRTPKGDIIHGKDGNPAPFHEAIGELISLLPNRDRILRGSGKAGSGSPGAFGEPLRPQDVEQLTARARAGDQDAIKALQARKQASGGLVMGTAFSRK